MVNYAWKKETPLILKKNNIEHFVLLKNNQ